MPWIPRQELLQPPSPTVVGEGVAIEDERGRVLGSGIVCPEPAPIALRVYARGATHVPFDDGLLADRLDRALARRKAFVGDADAYRVVHAEADLLPGLFVDRWGDAATLQTA